MSPAPESKTLSLADSLVRSQGEIFARWEDDSRRDGRPAEPCRGLGAALLPLALRALEESLPAEALQESMATGYALGDLLAYLGGLRRTMLPFLLAQPNFDAAAQLKFHEFFDRAAEAAAKRSASPSSVRSEEADIRAKLVGETVSAMPDVLFCISDDRHHFRYLSPAWERLLGYSVAELTSRPFLDFVHPDDLAATREEAARIAAGAPATKLVNRYLAKDGSPRWIRWTANLKDGLLYSFASDVTEYKQNELKLEQNRERFNHVSQATGLGVWYCDLPFAELIWNREVKEHFFLPPEAHVTIDTFYERIHPEDRELIRLAIAESNRTGERYDIEYRTTNPSRPEEIRWVRAVGWTSFDHGGKPYRFDGFTFDVTDQKRIEAELAESQAAILENEQMLQLITERLPSFVAYVDRDLRYRFMNAAYERCFGTGARRGKLLKDVVAPEVYERALPFSLRALAGESVRYENTVCGQDGREIVVDAEYLPDVHPRTGEVRGYVVVGHDITERKLAARALEISERRLRLALAASKIGIFEHDVESGETTMSEQMAADWGFPNHLRSASLYELKEVVHPEDRALLTNRLKTAIENGNHYDLELRIVRPNSGETRWVRTKGELTLGPDGKPTRLIGTVIDVTESRLAKDELAASAERFRSLAESIPQIVWTCDPRGVVSWFSQSWYDYTGMAPGEPWEKALHPDDARSTQETFTSATKNHRDYAVEHRLRGKDGTYRWFSVKAKALRDRHGRVVQWIGSSADINDRVETARVLRESSELFRRITDTIPQGVWRTTPDGKGDYFSQRFSELVGYPVEEMLGWGWAAVIHPEDQPRVLKAWQEGRDAQRPVAAEFRVKSAEGRYRWFISLGNPFFDGSGNLTHYYGTWTDIEEQKTRASQLQKLAETSLLLNSTRPLAEKLAIVTERAREILGAHRAILRLEPLVPGGVPVHDVSVSSKLSSEGGTLLDPERSGLYQFLRDLNRPLRFTRADLDENKSYREALRPHSPPRDGLLAATLADARGEPIGVLLLTDRYEGDFSEGDEGLFAQLAQIASAAIENAQLLEREQAAVVARDEFLSIASHELKTPLTSLKLQAQMFQRLVAKNDDRAYDPKRLNVIMDQTGRQVSRLTRLVDDMLDISRIRTGMLSIRLQPVLLADLVRESVERIHPHFTKEGLPDPVLELHGNPLVSADSVRFEQVLSNLLTNALRYGGGRPVTIRLAVREAAAVIEVRDEGIGIDAANLEKIFDRFERAVSANEVSGLGLGLFISRQIVRAHGGKIWAESSGCGSSFYVEIPVIPA